MSYWISRALSSVTTLVVLIVAVFFLLRVAPGGPFDAERAWPPEIQANIEKRYGLDQTLIEQFQSWAWDLARGDLRESFQYLDRPVSEIISQSLTVSALLGFSALFLAIALGLPLGIASALKPNHPIDHLCVTLAVAGVSLPTFLVASLFVLVFSLKLGWFPPALLETPSSYFLPILTLSFRPLSMIARMTRTTLRETLGEDYIRTAIGKGAPPFRVVTRHALKNALIPVVTLLGPVTASLVTGSFLVEVVFQLPGLGKHFVGSILNRDYPLALGATLTYGVVLLSVNLLVDFIYGFLDPRIRLK